MKKKISLIILFLVVVGIVGGSRWTRLYQSDAIHPKEPIDLYLRKDIGIQRLSHILVDSLHLVDNKKQLKWAADLFGWRSFKTGHYNVNHNMTYNDFWKN